MCSSLSRNCALCSRSFAGLLTLDVAPLLLFSSPLITLHSLLLLSCSPFSLLASLRLPFFLSCFTSPYRLFFLFIQFSLSFLPSPPSFPRTTSFLLSFPSSFSLPPPSTSTPFPTGFSSSTSSSFRSTSTYPNHFLLHFHIHTPLFHSPPPPKHLPLPSLPDLSLTPLPSSITKMGLSPLPHFS